MEAWQPANGTEQALAEAVERGDRPGYFAVLVAAALLLPARTDEPDGMQRFVVTQRFGVTFLPVFTSLKSLALVRTVADGAKDQPAADHVMGHEVAHMSSVYREDISDARLAAVADHVRAWLFGR